MVMSTATYVSSSSDAADNSVPTELAVAWQRTLHGWTDTRLHDTVLGIAAKHGQFAWLAARYRTIAQAQPGDPIPAARLARVQRATLATLCLVPTPSAAPARTPYRAAAIMLLGFVVAAFVGLRLVDMKSHDYKRAHQTHTHTVSKAK